MGKIGSFAKKGNSVIECRKQTLNEEILNSITHGMGTILGAVGTGILVANATLKSEIWGFVSSLIYGISLILLYLLSTLYHSFTNNRTKSIFRVLDHCTIFLLIWGTYAPVALSLIGGKSGGMLFIFQSVCALCGIVLNVINLNKWKNVSLVLYVLMGWAVIFNSKLCFSLLDIEGIMLLLSGGLAYTIGIVFYVKKNVRYMHVIWHVFVLVGSAFHYVFVLRYCI